MATLGNGIRTGISATGLDSIAERLLNPAIETDFSGLAHHFFYQTVKIRVAGVGQIPDLIDLLKKVKGALGESLKEGASDAVILEQVCSFDPPCALYVLNGKKPMLKIGHHTNELAKPYIVLADRCGQDLEIAVRVFGFACEWIQVVANALVDAVRHRIAWKRLANGRFIPRDITISSLQIETEEGVNLSPAPREVDIGFFTPMDTSSADLLEEPDSLITRLARRIAGLARWQDRDVPVDMKKLLEACRACDFTIHHASPKLSHTRKSNRQKSTYINDVRYSELSVSGDLSMIWPLLVIGSVTSVGRGAVAGLGQYRLQKII